MQGQVSKGATSSQGSWMPGPKSRFMSPLGNSTQVLANLVKGCVTDVVPNVGAPSRSPNVLLVLVNIGTALSEHRWGTWQQGQQFPGKTWAWLTVERQKGVQNLLPENGMACKPRSTELSSVDCKEAEQSPVHMSHMNLGRNWKEVAIVETLGCLLTLQLQSAYWCACGCV